MTASLGRYEVDGLLGVLAFSLNLMEVFVGAERTGSASFPQDIEIASITGPIGALGRQQQLA